MLKGYRRHFVVSNMLLTGLVLLVSFIVLGVFTYNNQRTELENTMNFIVKPWNSSSQPSQTIKPRPQQKNSPDAPRPDESKHNEPHGNDKKDVHDKNEGFTTIFYDKKNRKITVLSETTTYDNDFITNAVYEIAKQKDNFGTLKDYKIIYYKEATQNECKITITDQSYLTVRTVKNIVLLFFVFVASMGIILLISIKLSALAAKPMESAIEMERKFVADISHDLKTPITVILTNNSIIKSNLDIPAREHKQWIDSTDAAAKNMIKMVNEMLTLSSLESVSKEITKKPVNLSLAAEKCVLQMESLAYEKNVIVESNIGEDLIILAEEEYTERICSGLIDNALKYEPDGGTIRITTYADRKNAVLTVQNQGSVISADDMPHIFDRFYRGDKSRNLQSGYGLGLPIIKQITQLLDADIEACSDARNGTFFIVKFKLFQKSS